MIYAAYFSFIHDGHELRNGDFTCLVEAPDADAAADRLQALIARSIEGGDQFPEGTEIYLEQLTQVGKLPKDGVLVHYRSTGGEPTPTLYGALVFPPKLTGWAVFSTMGPEDVDSPVVPFFVVPFKKVKAKAKAKAKAPVKAKAKAKTAVTAKAKAKSGTKKAAKR